MMLNKKIKKIKNNIKNFFLINDSPHKIAAGAALGIFWGIMPGEGVTITLITASILRFNRLSATIGVLASNMWMTFVVMPFAALLGGKIFGLSSQMLIDDFKSTYDLGFKHFFTKTIFFDILSPLIVGFIIISLIISVFFYFLIFYFLKNHKMRFK